MWKTAVDNSLTPAASTWGFRPWLAAVGALLIAIGAGLALLTSEGRDRIVAGAAAVVGIVLVLVVLRLRHRLVVDRVGMTIRRFVGTDVIPWSEVLDIRSVAHRRMGSRSSLLELDLIDDGFLVFSATELGAPTDDVARRLRAWRSGNPLPESDDLGF
ncbi:PH domain-containing protein [Nakamurella sp. A5-74]|uniref:PH domain-containing protein n=1 Tax=Nakamurella sp. A5-74 TaxID=3158264 RepID=A0AAU8DPJ2_9ACTN